MSEQENKSGWYRDEIGRDWHCINHHVEQRMICNTGHSMTVANYPTFRQWGWKPSDAAPAPSEARS